MDAKRFPSGCVASPHYLASAAGLAVLAGGGNAMDAAVATNLVLGVVTPYLCGYGGDLFAMVWQDGVHAYNGSGRAPEAATVEAVRAAAGQDRLPSFGPLTVTVPGAVEGWFALLDRFGTRSFAELAGPARRYAFDGFPLTPAATGALHRSSMRYAAFPEWTAVYGPALADQVLRQPALARTIDLVAAEGPDAYYRGPIGQAIAEHVASAGGLLTPADLAGHRGEWVEPLRTAYRGHEVIEMPPNAQGVAVLETLNIVQAMGPLPVEGPDRHHLLIEATKLALVDRDAFVSDPAAMRVPAGDLASPAWGRDRARAIDLAAAAEPTPGRAAVGGTAYLCAADSEGMGVSLIQSNYMGFGSGLTVPEWGVNLQNRGAYFSLDPDHVNVVAPGKRTLHTLIPAMVLRDGRPMLLFGSMGGDGQAQTHVQVLTRILDDGENVQRAIDAPRWIVSLDDWSVTAEDRFDPAWAAGLAARGHRMAWAAPYESLMGHAHAILFEPGGYAGGTDPRAEGAVMGR